MSLGSRGGHLRGRQECSGFTEGLELCAEMPMQQPSDKVPSAFRNALWLLAPPKKLEPGQHDLLHEAEAGLPARYERHC